MKLVLRAEKRTWSAGEEVAVQLIAINDSYEAVALDRRLLVGPNPVPAKLEGIPFPVSVEPAFSREEQNVVMLNPWCFYGRERFWKFPAGRVTFYGYLLRRPVEGMPPEGPKDYEALAVAAEPLVLRVR
ncbi:MAG: hypothetical protein DRI40_08130 [Chloroflexi bacterium]|nr:MAG: hypothetical protein DRI40_08130 [Chloroflexota bacterium]